MSEPSTEIVLAPLRQSESISVLAKFLVLAQREVKGAKKDAQNPHFKSKYADLASVSDACREALSKHGFAVIQSPGYDGPTKCVTVTTRLLHESAEWIEGTAGAPIEERAVNAQGVGSAVTYLRRYSLAAMAGVVTEDDDGNAASRPAKREARPEHINRDGEMILPGVAKNWGGFGGQPLAKVPDKALIACRDWHKERGQNTTLIIAIDEVLEDRRSGAEGAPTGTSRGSTPVRGTPATPSQAGGKPVSPNPGATDDGQGDPPMPHAVLEEDEIDALIASVERGFREAKGVVPEGKLALMEQRWKSFGANPEATQCIIMLGQLSKAKASKDRAPV